LAKFGDTLLHGGLDHAGGLGAMMGQIRASYYNMCLCPYIGGGIPLIVEPVSPRELLPFDGGLLVDGGRS
jgi:hypothetical protein